MLRTAAALQAALAIPNVVMTEAPRVNSDAQPDVVSPYPQVEAGYALPLDGPGLGVTFNEKSAPACACRCRSGSRSRTP